MRLSSWLRPRGVDGCSLATFAPAADFSAPCSTLKIPHHRAIAGLLYTGTDCLPSVLMHEVSREDVTRKRSRSGVGSAIGRSRRSGWSDSAGSRSEKGTTKASSLLLHKQFD